jgi:hypothetical protein
MFDVENLTINNGADIPAGGEVRFDIPIPARWVKIAYIKIVALTTGTHVFDFDIWEVSTYNPATPADRVNRRLRRNIALGAGDDGEYGEALHPLVPYKDKDTVDEERTYALHCRLRNDATGVASDFAVMIRLADISEGS